MRLYFLALGSLLSVCAGCAYDGQQLLETNKNNYYAPPAETLIHPGPMVGGPGPGVLQASYDMPMQQPTMPAMMMPPPDMGIPMISTTQIRFLGPEGMHVGWQIGNGFAENQLIAPQRYNFRQGATYRLKLSQIPGPGREGLVVYPSLHVYPTHPTTAAYLEHNALPLRINDEDLDQVQTNNFVTKVIYLPDAKYQELAIAGVEELVSTRLAPGQDPVTEADRRGTIMAVIRMGNMDLEMPGEVGGMAQATGPHGEILQTAFADGDNDQHVAPVPVGSYQGIGYGGVPSDMMMGSSGGPGQPAYNPIVGVSGAPQYGMPSVGTPIGLPGPPHIPLGRPAGMQSVTLRNTTDYHVAPPARDLLIDVRHEPGIRMPDPVEYIQYTEKHPGYEADQLSVPAWAQGGAGQAPYCPPQQ